MIIASDCAELASYFFPAAEKSELSPDESEFGGHFSEFYVCDGVFDVVLIEKFAQASQFDRLVSAELPGKILALAESGKGFHGQHNRVWALARGGLYLCAQYPISLPTDRYFELIARGALAVCEAARDCGVSQAMISWPNDLFVDGKKAGGVLSSARVKDGKIYEVVYGIGINVESAPVFDLDRYANPTYLSLRSPGLTSVDYFARLIECLEVDLYAKFSDIRRRYNKLHYGIGKKIILCNPASDKVIADGIFVGLDEEMRCIVEGYDAAFSEYRLRYAD